MAWLVYRAGCLRFYRGGRDVSGKCMQRHGEFYLLRSPHRLVWYRVFQPDPGAALAAEVQVPAGLGAYSSGFWRPRCRTPLALDTEIRDRQLVSPLRHDLLCP